jgi:UDP-N-acetylglucosamine--N-acetylmuramyl-(pentapeptide) pyrophosphoryl-undecaprenol N-acetylglucosamine transferase
VSARVVVAGGGTGGHVFPGLAVARELKARDVEVHWLGARKGLEAELVPERGFPITLVEIEGMQARSSTAAMHALSLLPRAVATAVHTIRKMRPLAVVGVGGYASAAGLAAAGLQGVPVILQEQNSIPGWTNSFLAPLADLICCGFEDALGAFPSMPAEWTGNPVRTDFFDVPDVTTDQRPSLLILGGSQGSLFLNRSLPQALAILRDEGIEVAIRHQAGVRWAEVVRTAYSDLKIEATVSAFLAQPWSAMAEADLVVARSGALTVSELAASGRGALLVPFAAAAGNHQEFNARSLERAGGAVVLTEDVATPRSIADALLDLLGDAEVLKRMGANSRKMALPGAAARIAQRILEVAS